MLLSSLDGDPLRMERTIGSLPINGTETGV
ncbi:hypothetical protein MTR67_008475, partial [Solanum verrucosum]